MYVFIPLTLCYLSTKRYVLFDKRFLKPEVYKQFCLPYVGSICKYSVESEEGCFVVNRFCCY